MSLSDRGHELIQKYLEALASESEIAELEGLLAADPDVAAAFAAAARLEAGLASYFRQQYKIDQVAALLNAPETPAAPVAGTAAAGGGDLAEPRLPPGSTFIPRLDRQAEARQATAARGLTLTSRRRKAISAAALVFLGVGVAVWSSKRAADEPFRLISGRLSKSGSEVTFVPENTTFEVADEETAVIELPGGAHVELAAATRGSIRRDRTGLIVKLDSGGGEFRIPAGASGFRVETKFGVVTTAGAQFSLTFVAGPPAHFSQAAPGVLPNLTVAVAEGNVTVEQRGNLTRLSAHQQHVFFGAT